MIYIHAPRKESEKNWRKWNLLDVVSLSARHRRCQERCQKLGDVKSSHVPRIVYIAYVLCVFYIDSLLILIPGRQRYTTAKKKKQVGRLEMKCREERDIFYMQLFVKDSQGSAAMHYRNVLEMI